MIVTLRAAAFILKALLSKISQWLLRMYGVK